MKVMVAFHTSPQVCYQGKMMALYPTIALVVRTLLPCGSEDPGGIGLAPAVTGMNAKAMAVTGMVTTILEKLTCHPLIAKLVITVGYKVTMTTIARSKKLPGEFSTLGNKNSLITWAHCLKGPFFI